MAEGVWGREAERERVRDFCTVGPVTPPAGLLIVGEPGIGKTTLLREGVAAARAAGVRVVTTVCGENEVDMPYGGLGDLVSTLFDDHGADLPAPQQEAVGGALLRRAVDAPTEPRTVSAGLLTLLRAATADRPVLLAVDNLQWLDAETQRCLTYALRRVGPAPLRLALCARDGSPLSGADDAAGRPFPRPLTTALGEPETIELSGLDAGAVRRLLRSRLHTALPRDVVRRIVEDTRGNPFWALEFGRALAGDEWDGLARPPASLSRLVAHRLDRLDPAVLEAACVVAAFRRATTGTVLTAMDDRADVDLEDVLDEAVSHGLIRAAHGTFAVAHPLIGNALLEALPPFRRRRMYRRVAALARSPEERALHLLRAVEALDSPSAAGPGTTSARDRATLLDALDRAADDAESRGALASATRFADRAVAWNPPGAPATRRLVRAARLRFRAASFARAATLLSAVDLGTLDRDELDETVPLYADCVFRADGEPAARAVADRVARLGGASRDPALRDRCHALVATLRSDPQHGGGPARVSRAAEAERATRECGSLPAVRHRALGNLLYAQLDDGLPIDGALLDARQELESPGAGPGGPAGVARDTGPGRDAEVRGTTGVPPYVAESSALLRARIMQVEDRLDDAAGLLGAHLRDCRDAGDEVGLLRSGISVVYIDLLRGRTAGIDATLADLRELADREPPAPPELVSVRGLLALARGEYDRVDELIADADDHPSPAPRHALLVGHLRGVLALHRGRPSEAVRHLRDFVRAAGRLGIREPARRLMADGDLADACVDVGDLDGARGVADHLAAVARGRRTLLGMECRVRARIAAGCDDHAAALRDARRAVAHHLRCPRPAELGRSLIVLAETYAGTGDRTAAARYARRARDVLAGCGWVPWSDRAGALARNAAAATALTPAEETVARLVARGASNREVATALHLSVRTIEGHLSSVFRKLGVRSRTELARRF